MILFCIIRLALIVLSIQLIQQTATAFTGPRLWSNKFVETIGINHSPRSSSSTITFSSSNNNDWGLEDSSKDEDPRLEAMRSMLESSWDGTIMGIVPSDSERAAEAASESVADAMRQNKNVLMVDLRLPSYDITEGPKMYDIVAAYDFCSFLSDELRKRKLIRKSLILVRNEKERAEIDRVTSERDRKTASTKEDVGDMGGAEAWGVTGESEGGSEVDDFRKKLMTSWDSTADGVADDNGGSNARSPPPGSEKKVFENNDSSHRLWSMVGSEEISGGADMFDQVIAAVDENARLSGDEDALVVLSPYDTADVIGVRRIMARYGQTRTIIIVNSRMEALPRELDPAVLVYGILPLIAKSRGDKKSEAGLKAVVMKRFPSNWAVYVDVYGDGFVEAKGNQPAVDSSDKLFPSPEWIALRVQAHVEGLSK